MKARPVRRRRGLRGLIALSVSLAQWAITGCAPAGRFPLREPLWEDPDRVPFDSAPDEYVSPMVWDVGDQSIFYPLTRVFAVDPAGEALNVNSLDEVPDSSWFTNRISSHRMSPEQVALGPCEAGSPEPPTPWQVSGAKPNGANPGFLIVDARGGRHLVKFDGVVQGPRATAADVIASKLYYAAGYSVPCNRVVFFDRDAVSIAEGATAENAVGDKEPLTPAHLQAVFAMAGRLPDGRLRASTSQFLPGVPIGPFQYQGTLGADPNDVVPHQDRRELRALRLLAAWTHHFDAREQNTLSMWIPTGQDQGYVRHNLIDFGDCFGSVWDPPPLGRRLGHSHYFDLEHTLEDWLTLGLWQRPWDTARFGASGKVFGYYRVNDFEPESWKAGYPNPAFRRMSERDGAWMARIVAAFGDQHLRAAISQGRFGSTALSAELLRLLAGRRDRILERYLTRLSPLSSAGLRRGTQAELCLRDLVAASGLRGAHERRYAVTVYPEGSTESQRLAPVRRAAGQRVCVELPRQAGASPGAPGYLRVDWVAQSDSFPAELPARVHLYDLGPGGLRVVGLERPDTFEPPG